MYIYTQTICIPIDVPTSNQKQLAGNCPITSDPNTRVHPGSPGRMEILFTKASIPSCATAERNEGMGSGWWLSLTPQK